MNDLLIKGGTLVDPAQAIHGTKDVAFSNRKVVEVADILNLGIFLNNFNLVFL